jgi:hypothetical protein
MHRCKHICKPLQANTQTKVCKRASTSPTQEELFFKIPFPSKIFKTATAQPTHNNDQNTNLTMTTKPLSHLTFTIRTTRTPAGNSVYVAIAGEVVNRRSVLLRNFVLNGQESASNPLLHIHAKRYSQCGCHTT